MTDGQVFGNSNGFRSDIRKPFPHVGTDPLPQVVEMQTLAQQVADNAADTLRKTHFSPLGTVSSLKEVNKYNRNDQDVRVVEFVGFYQYDAESRKTPDDYEVLKPNDIMVSDAGRWLLIVAITSGFYFDKPVKDKTHTAPPVTPVEGDRYIIAAPSTGIWTGKAKQIATYNSSGWTYVIPKEGCILYVDAENIFYLYDGSAWSSFTSTIPTATTTIKGIMKVSHTPPVGQDPIATSYQQLNSVSGAGEVGFDNSVSGLAATDVQAAIDEVDSDLDTHIGDTSNPHNVTYTQVGAIQDTTDVIKDTHIDWGDGVGQVDASDVPYDNTTTGMVATDVQSAINELKVLIDKSELLVTVGSSGADYTDLDTAIDAIIAAGRYGTIRIITDLTVIPPSTIKDISNIKFEGFKVQSGPTLDFQDDGATTWNTKYYTTNASIFEGITAYHSATGAPIKLLGTAPSILIRDSSIFNVMTTEVFFDCGSIANSRFTIYGSFVYNVDTVSPIFSNESNTTFLLYDLTTVAVNAGTIYRESSVTIFTSGTPTINNFDNSLYVSYDPSASGLAATNVKEAIDEVDSDLDTHIGDTSNPHSVTYSQVGAIQDTTDVIKDTHVDWGEGAGQVSSSDVPYNNSTSGMTASDVKSAIDELKIDGFLTLKEPTGFLSRTTSQISFDNGLMRFTIEPKAPAASFDFYIKGKKYTKSTAQTVDITDIEGLWYFYFNGSGVLTASQVFPDLTENTFVSYIHWNADSNVYVVFADERHGTVMDGITHTYLHKTIGARYYDGLGITGTAGDGSSNTHAQISVANGDIYDEDLLVDIRHSASPTNPFEQILTPTAQLPVYYRSGTNGDWRKKVADTYPLYQGSLFGATRIGYNYYNTGTSQWEIAEVGEGRYTISWVFAINSQSEPVIVVLDQSTYNNLTSARNATFNSLSMGSAFAAEIKVLFKIIWQTSSSYSNTPKARYIENADYRLSQTPATGTFNATSHQALSNRGDDGCHPASAIDFANTTSGLVADDVQGAIDEIVSDGINHRFGDGRDGSVTISGDTTLTKDMYYNDLTVNAGVTLTTDNYKIFVLGTLTLNGTIKSGSGLSGGNGTTTNGSAGQDVPSVVDGGTGGAGGNGASGTGGAGGTGTQGASLNRDSVLMPVVIYNTEIDQMGGAGGGGGAGDTSNAGGDGGNGGGLVFICGKTISISATGKVDVSGIDGSNAAAGNCGGGGGGAGGVYILLYGSYSNLGTIDISGGSGGSKSGTGIDGSVGGDGKTITLKISA